MADVDIDQLRDQLGWGDRESAIATALAQHHQALKDNGYNNIFGCAENEMLRMDLPAEEMRVLYDQLPGIIGAMFDDRVVKYSSTRVEDREETWFVELPPAERLTGIFRQHFRSTKKLSRQGFEDIHVEQLITQWLERSAGRLQHPTALMNEFWEVLDTLVPRDAQGEIDTDRAAEIEDALRPALANVAKALLRRNSITPKFATEMRRIASKLTNYGY